MLNNKVIIHVLETEPPPKPAFGTNLYKYIEDQIQKTANSFLGEKFQNIGVIQNAVERKLLNFSEFLDIPSVDVQVDPYDPTKFNIKVRINVPWSREMVIMNPANHDTHWWATTQEPGYYRCARCGIFKTNMAQSVIERCTSSGIILAQYDLSCDESIIKDIIE